jgi:multisubunit Na+/H+ antiporter MnhB subunit
VNCCEKPPAGWLCTREAGHDGPCAAVREVEQGFELEEEGISFRRAFEIAFVIAVGLLASAVATFNFAAGLGFVGGLLVAVAGSGCWYLILREEREGKL